MLQSLQSFFTQDASLWSLLAMPPAVLPMVATATAGHARSGYARITANNITSDDSGISVAAKKLPARSDQRLASPVKNVCNA